METSSEPTPTENFERKENRRVFVQRKFPRSIVSYIHSYHSTLAYRAIFWLLPWGVEHYPGIRRGIMELLGGSVSWSTVRAYRNGQRRMNARVADQLADIIERRVTVAQGLIAELREYGKTHKDGRSKPAGFCVVRDRDGTVIDGRLHKARVARPDVTGEVKRPVGRPRKNATP